MKSVLGLLVLIGLLVPPGPAGARRRHVVDVPSAGAFDYYLLSLSWSPQHCSEKPGDPDDAQCGTHRRFGFVLHGLWPQYASGGYPQSCPAKSPLTPRVIDGMLDVMPSPDLIRHEWQKHGTCSGASPEVFFQRAREAFRTLTIPERYRSPDDAFRVTAADVRRDFRAANAALPADGVAVLCNGHFFTELRVCLSKDERAPRACGRGVTDQCRGEVTVRPLR